MESASTLKCHCELFDDEFQFLFRDILPDAVESHFDSPLSEDINSQIWTKRIVLHGTKYN